MSNESTSNASRGAGRQDEHKQMLHEGHDTQHAPDAKPVPTGLAVMTLVIVLIVFAALATFGILSRIHHTNVLAKSTQELAAPVVIALAPKQGAASDTFSLPGNVTAYTDSPIYARTTGYLTKWYHDIGSHVKKGELLAEIATPELDQQLAQAEADLGTSEANAKNAKAQAQRYQGLVNTNAVSQQDTENFTNQATATASSVKSAQANVERLKQLQSFEKIYAPFDGVITARNTDIGQLIDSGSSGGATRELFHIAAVDRLRVFANVPQVYSHAAKPGIQADLTLPELPGRRFPGKLVRTADSIDPNTRTLLVEVDVLNRTGLLFPGAYTDVHFNIPSNGSTLIIPSASLIFRSQGLRVPVVKDNRVSLLPVVVGRDFGTTIEVLSGLNEGASVILNPPDSLVEGEVVRVVQPKQTKEAEE